MEEIKKCPICKSENFRDVTVDFIDNIETEKERICNDCGELMDYWAFGYWESNSVTKPKTKGDE